MNFTIWEIVDSCSSPHFQNIPPISPGGKRGKFTTSSVWSSRISSSSDYVVEKRTKDWRTESKSHVLLDIVGFLVCDSLVPIAVSVICLFFQFFNAHMTEAAFYCFCHVFPIPCKHEKLKLVFCEETTTFPMKCTLIELAYQCGFTLLP